jgi:hypothetical protein
MMGLRLPTINILTINKAFKKYNDKTENEYFSEEYRSYDKI